MLLYSIFLNFCQELFCFRTLYTVSINPISQDQGNWHRTVNTFIIFGYNFGLQLQKKFVKSLLAIEIQAFKICCTAAVKR